MFRRFADAPFLFRCSLAAPADETAVEQVVHAGKERGFIGTQIQGQRKSSVPWGTILSNSSVWAITVSYFCYGYGARIFFAWFYVYLARVRGMNLKSSAYGTLPFLAMAIGCAVGGLLADSLTKKVSRRVGRCGVASSGSHLRPFSLRLVPP